jgi:hypothetical protein
MASTNGPPGATLSLVPPPQLQQQPPPPTGVDPLPIIRISPEEENVVNLSIEALADNNVIYQTEGLGLVRIMRGADDFGPKAPVIQLLPPTVLREQMAATAHWEKFIKTERRFVWCHLPEWAIGAVMDRGKWKGIRNLTGVIEVPTMRMDGTILMAPGYDERTGLVYEPAGPVLPVAANPTQTDAVAALAELVEMVCDFPFASPAHLAGWLAGLLTPIVSPGHGWKWCAPLFLFDANTRGAGKSLLADLIAILVTGRHMFRVSLPETEDEARKMLISAAIAGDQLMFFDETRTIQGRALNAVLTGRLIKDRVLGESKMVDALFKATAYASGNNVLVKGDSARRVILSRLETPDEHPEDRSKFKHHNVKGWALEHRPRLVRACLTILRAYHLAGRPAQRSPLGSFEGWSRAVRDPLIWAGAADCCETRKLLMENDPDESSLRQILAGWQEIGGVEEALTIAQAGERMKRSPILCALFEEWEVVVGDKIKTKVIAARIRRLKGRWLNNAKLNMIPGVGVDIARWQVEKRGAGQAPVAPEGPPQKTLL